MKCCKCKKYIYEYERSEVYKHNKFGLCKTCYQKYWSLKWTIKHPRISDYMSTNDMDTPQEWDLTRYLKMGMGYKMKERDDI